MRDYQKRADLMLARRHARLAEDPFLSPDLRWLHRMMAAHYWRLSR